MSIRNLVFDCGEVLVHFDLLEIARHFAPTEEDAALLADAFEPNWHSIDAGSVSYEEFCAAVLEKLPQRLREAAAGMQREWYRTLPPIPGMQEFLAEAAERYDCYLLSNAPVFFGEHLLEAVPTANVLKGKLISGEEQMVKPDEAIYRRFLERFGLEAGECLFMDDKAVNVAAAEAVGIHGLVFDGRVDSVRERLKELERS